MTEDIFTLAPGEPDPPAKPSPVPAPKEPNPLEQQRVQMFHALQNLCEQADKVGALIVSTYDANLIFTGPQLWAMIQTGRFLWGVTSWHLCDSNAIRDRINTTIARLERQKKDLGL